MTSRQIEILDYNALKTSELQNSLFIIYNITIKILHYKTFYNTTDLTFHSNKTISSHIKSQNIITQVPKFWPSREHWKTHNQHMHFSLPTTQIFILKPPLARMMALVWYVTSWDPNVELIHGECLSVYQTFHCFNVWYSRQSNVHNKTVHRELFTCDVTKLATTWSHPCIKHTTWKPDSQRSILYYNIQQTHYTTVR